MQSNYNVLAAARPTLARHMLPNYNDLLIYAFTTCLTPILTYVL